MPNAPASSISGRKTAPPSPKPASQGPETFGGAATVAPKGRASSNPAGSIAPKLRIIELVGQGGMGAVYKAEDTNLGRIVALKRLRASDTGAREGIERFLREAKAVAALNHPNIVTTYFMSEDADGPFIVMEYLDGKTLHALIQEAGKLPLADALRIADGVGKALAHAHRYHVIHRDVKPGNTVVLRDGTPKVLDFGLARVGLSPELTQEGQSMGTMDYAAPEQRAGSKTVDHRADIFSFGATLFEMLTGRSPRVVRPDRLPEELRSVVTRCLEERPEDRPFSMDDVLAELQNVSDGSSSSGGRKRGKSARVPTAEGNCVSCGSENPQDVRFCQACGKPLFEACPACEQETRIGIAFCGRCGVNIAKRREAIEALNNGIAALESCKYDDAAKAFEDAQASDPGMSEVAERLNEAHAKAQQLAASIKEALAAQREGDLDREYAAVLKAEKLSPNSDDIKKWRSKVEKQLEHREAERQAATRARNRTVAIFAVLAVVLPVSTYVGVTELYIKPERRERELERERVAAAEEARREQERVAREEAQRREQEADEAKARARQREQEEALRRGRLALLTSDLERARWTEGDVPAARVDEAVRLLENLRVRVEQEETSSLGDWVPKVLVRLKRRHAVREALKGVEWTRRDLDPERCEKAIHELGTFLREFDDDAPQWAAERLSFLKTPRLVYERAYSGYGTWTGVDHRLRVAFRTDGSVEILQGSDRHYFLPTDYKGSFTLKGTTLNLTIITSWGSRRWSFDGIVTGTAYGSRLELAGKHAESEMRVEFSLGLEQ